jgi:hypothetical protein
VSKLDFALINKYLDASSCVPEWLPAGKREGQNWVARNPTRDDKTAGSFSVSLKTGKWADFSSSDHADRGGDLVGLYAYIKGMSQGDAAKALATQHGIVLDTAEGRAKAAANAPAAQLLQQPEPILPAPDNAPAPEFVHFKMGAAEGVWEYLDEQGRTLLYVCRFNPPGERKQVIPLTWCKHPNGKASRWTWKGLDGKTKRPLYGIQRLVELPDADVYLVEGEKTADAGQLLMKGQAAVVTWMGGSGAVEQNADRIQLKPLAGRRVVLIPDFDAQVYPDAHALAGEVMAQHEQPGMRAMLNLARALKGVASSVFLVGYRHGEFAAGWDLADGLTEGWTDAKVLDYIKANAGDPISIAAGKLPAPAAAPAAAAAPAPAAPAERKTVALNAAVNPFGFPHQSEKNRPMNTVENLQYMLDQYGISTKYNQVKKLVELKLPGKNYTADNEANCALAELNSISARNYMPQSMLQDYVKLLADANAYNPVADWVQSKPWDGISRLDDIFSTIVAADSMADELKRALIYRWLLSAVAAIFKPFGFTSHGVLVFTGDQGQGKTSWVKSLVPLEMGLVLEGAAIDPDNKDSLSSVLSHWLVELGELDGTFRKADIARLKQFITKGEDRFRRPYDRLDSSYQRRTVFFASVNAERYLVDDTGNRRWWTVPVVIVDYLHTIDMQQVWAELLLHYQRGEQWWLTQDEQTELNALNKEHEATDPIEEKILRAFDWGSDGVGGEEMTASEVLLLIGNDKPNRSDATHASKILKRLAGPPIKRNNGRFFKLPKRIYGRRQSDHADDDRPL